MGRTIFVVGRSVHAAMWLLTAFSRAGLTKKELAMTSMTMLACAGCWNPIGAGAVPVLLGDLAFHALCAPRCRACDISLADVDEQRVTYEGQVIWSPSGYTLRPTELWCDSCRELHERDIAFAQD